MGQAYYENNRPYLETALTSEPVTYESELAFKGDQGCFHFTIPLSPGQALA